MEISLTFESIRKVCMNLEKDSSYVNQINLILDTLMVMTKSTYGYIGRIIIHKSQITADNKTGKCVEIVSAMSQNNFIKLPNTPFVRHDSTGYRLSLLDTVNYSGKLYTIPIHFCGEQYGELALGCDSIEDFIENNLSLFYGIIGSLLFKMNIHQDKLKLLDDKEITKAKSMFMANVSHEIRTPLNSIIGSIDYLSELDLPRGGSETLEIMKQSSWNLLTLVNDILDISGLESGKVDIFLSSALVSEIITTSYSIAKSAQKIGVEFIQQINADVPDTIIMDPQRTKQILINLLSNAFKFTENGRVKIEVSIASPEEIHEMNLVPADYVSLNTSFPHRTTRGEVVETKRGKTFYIKFAVSDTGIGIKQSDIRKLFKSFSQVDSSTTKKYGGTGLGLAISQGLCNLMQGDINLMSEYKVGSCFYFIIPVQEYISSKRNSVDKSILEEISVLIVDDKVENIMRLTQILDQYKINYITCTAARHAIVSYINNSRYHFDIGLIDIFMPEMDGNELASYISKTDKAFPLIALSSSSSNVNSISGVFDATLPKPYSEDQLITAMYNIINSKRKRNFIKNQNTDSKKSKRRSIKNKSRSNRLSSDHSKSYHQSIMDKIVNDNININILVVEDNEFNQMTVQKLLNCLGYYNITIVSSGAEAIQAIKKSVSKRFRRKSSNLKDNSGTNFKITEKSKFHVILMDIVMPEMSGIEASRKIINMFSYRNLCPKIIAVTANVMAGDKEACLETGKMDGYISKPISKRVLGDVIGRICI